MGTQAHHNMLPCEHFWRRIEELKVSSEYMLAIFRIYEKVIYFKYKSNEILDYFNCTIGLKKGCPRSPIIFGACIDELEQMAPKFIKEEKH